MKTSDKILSILADSKVGLTAKDLTSRIGVTEQAIKTACWKLSKRGLIAVTHRNRKTKCGKRIQNVYSLID